MTESIVVGVDGSGRSVRALVWAGAPAGVLLTEAERAHSLVLGAKGIGGFGSLLLGSVVLQVVGHAACPVVVVNHVINDHRRIVVERTAHRLRRPH
ncbi:universal stress protein [Streptomyces noursei]|uniref:universal stress protein n=1 Tax=Streptomyces noursei TaxID=1971 RepID=UPI0037A77871